MSDILASRDGNTKNSPRYLGQVNPPWERFLTDDSGKAFNLTGMSLEGISVTFTNISNPALVITGAGTFSIINALSGGVEYQYATQDLALGMWQQQISAQLLGETHPRIFDPEILEVLPL